MKKIDFKDPFNAGQMVGMLVMLTFIENNDGMSEDMLYQLKKITVNNVQEYFDKPAEDIYLMINNIIKEVI